MARGNFQNYKIDFSKTDATLRDVFGDEPIPPTEMSKKLWAFIKEKGIAGKV